MLRVLAPLINKENIELNEFLLEKKYDLTFSISKKFYYSFLRPIIPIFIRQKIQKKYNSKVVFRENFVYTDLVEFYKIHFDFNSLLKNFYPNNYTCSILLTHDVEEETGFKFIPKVIELEEKYGFKSSWNIVPYKYKIDEGIIKLIENAEHEIGIHGYNHDGKLYYSEKIFNYRSKFINEALKKYNAVGFRSPQVHRNLEWLQKLDIRYDASCFDYDPFQPFPGGTGSIWPFIVGKFVELPYTLPQDHTLFYVLQVKNIEIWQKKIDWLCKNNGMILALTHPDYLIAKQHLNHYEELLMSLKSVNNAWHCLPKEFADWYLNKQENKILTNNF